MLITLQCPNRYLQHLPEPRSCPHVLQGPPSVPISTTAASIRPLVLWMTAPTFLMDFSPLSPGRRYQSIHTTTTRVKNSCFPESVRLFNTLPPSNTYLDYSCPSQHRLLCNQNCTPAFHNAAIGHLYYSETLMLLPFIQYYCYTSLHRQRFTDNCCTVFSIQHHCPV